MEQTVKAICHISLGSLSKVSRIRSYPRFFLGRKKGASIPEEEHVPPGHPMAVRSQPNETRIGNSSRQSLRAEGISLTIQPHLFKVGLV
jgi:hypothetical protein